jgi:Histidine kinase/Histidine kinase-, DNA gyrase B-, and HSP90-like ATPase
MPVCYHLVVGAETTSLSLTRTMRWRNLLRSSIPSMKYATAVTFGLIAAWAVEEFIDGASDSGISSALIQKTGTVVWAMVLHQMPAVPFVAIAVDSAPRSHERRYVYLAIVCLTLWSCWTWLGLLLGESAPVPERSAYVACLLVTACAFRGSAKASTSVFFTKEIDGAALDANLKRARLQLLRAQMEPHFLFNTLATVGALARIDRVAAVDMIDHLMRYLSEALPKLRQEETSLAQEFQLVGAYLRIHQIRMGMRLSYELSDPDDLGAERIPTMLLLTLVENSVKHGINPTVGGGYIRVAASRVNAALVLQVSDSGSGMAVTEGHGMGLANVRSRLTLLYGKGAVLTLARANTRGTVATVSLPLGRPKWD